MGASEEALVSFEKGCSWGLGPRGSLKGSFRGSFKGSFTGLGVLRLRLIKGLGRKLGFRV